MFNLKFRSYLIINYIKEVVKVEVNIYKRRKTYVQADGSVKNVDQFFIKCGCVLVPIKVAFFGTDEKPDYQYSGRKAVLSSYSEELTD